jgi:hypothetical protein
MVTDDFLPIASVICCRTSSDMSFNTKERRNCY